MDELNTDNINLETLDPNVLLVHQKNIHPHLLI